MSPGTGIAVDHSVLVSIALGGRGTVVVNAAQASMATVVVPSAALATALLHDDVHGSLDAQNALFELLRWERCLVDDLTAPAAGRIAATLFGDDLREVRDAASTLAVGHTAVAAAARGIALFTCRPDLWDWYGATGVHTL